MVDAQRQAPLLATILPSPHPEEPALEAAMREDVTVGRLYVLRSMYLLKSSSLARVLSSSSCNAGSRGIRLPAPRLPSGRRSQ